MLHLVLVAALTTSTLAYPFQDRWSESPETRVITIPSLGKVRGVVHPDTKVVTFRGIPFAKPPVADRRWKPPVEGDGWEGILDGTKSGAQCPQVHNSNEPIPTGLSNFMSEDW